MTFTLDRKEVEKINEWKEHIKEVFGEFGEFTYSFTPNGIGTTIKVYSVIADVEKDFTDVSSW